MSLPPSDKKKKLKPRAHNKGDIKWEDVCQVHTEEEAKKQRIGFTKWLSKNNATSSTLSAVTYGCSMHTSCPAVVRVTHLKVSPTMTDPQAVYAVQRAGTHAVELNTIFKGF